MKLIRELIYLLVDTLGVNFLFRRWTGDKVRILMYHGVDSRALPTIYWTQLDKERFSLQVKHVKQKFAVVRLSSLLASNVRQDQPLAAITFDDGLENTFTNAWPILQDFGLPATCFVVPSLSEEKRRIWADELYSLVLDSLDIEIDLGPVGIERIIRAGTVEQRAASVDIIVEELKQVSPEKRQAVMDAVSDACCPDSAAVSDELMLMTKEQIIVLAQSQEFEIAGHSDTHPILSTLSPEQQRQEIENCMSRLKSWGLDPPSVFAYPNGREKDFDEHTIVALKQSGCTAAVTTIDDLWDRSTDRFRLPRIAIGADISLLEFKARMSGLFYFLRRVSRFLLGQRPERREA